MKKSYLIVGLGNPEPEYNGTRHNAGAMILNSWVGAVSAPQFKIDKKMNAQVTEVGDCLLVKPQTYMNESGQAVAAIVNYFKLSLDALYIIHDDLDIPLGTYKIQHGKGPKEHNGLLSLYAHLGSKNFWHVRVGVDAREGLRAVSPTEYVLQRFPPQEREQFEQVTQKVIERLTSLCTA